MRTVLRTALPWLAASALIGCGDDGGSAQVSPEDDDGSESGFASTTSGADGEGPGTTQAETTGGSTESGRTSESSGDTSPGEGTTGTASTTEGGDTTSSSGDEAADTYETLGEGTIRGLLTFTYYAPDALNVDPVIGLAGAYRDNTLDFSAIDDFFGVQSLDLHFPVPPVDDDTLEHNDIPPSFDWGSPLDWQLAGNGMKLRQTGIDALACLLYRGQEPTIEIPPRSMSVLPQLPDVRGHRVQPAACRMHAASELVGVRWRVRHRAVRRASSSRPTRSSVQVHTPTALEVTVTRPRHVQSSGEHSGRSRDRLDRRRQPRKPRCDSRVRSRTIADVHRSVPPTTASFTIEAADLTNAGSEGEATHHRGPRKCRRCAVYRRHRQSGYPLRPVGIHRTAVGRCRDS